MSVEVMYQPYSSYFPYQRAPVSHATDTLKKFGASRMQDSLESLAYGNSVLSSSLALGGGMGLGGAMAASAAASGSASSTAASPVASSSTVKSEEDSSDKDCDQALSTQYLGANCVLITYFNGDIASNVDDHFTRALSQPSSFNAENQGSKPGQPWKDVSPMSQRNFPASFWNSSYQGSLSSASHHHDLSSLHSADPYMASSLHAMSSLHHQDPWRTYSGLTSATQPHTYTPHASMHDLAYSSMSASRFNSHYGSLLPSAAAASRLHGGMSGQCDLTVKHSAADWSSRYATDALTSHVHDAHAVHSATSIPGGGIDVPSGVAVMSDGTGKEASYNWF